jgi:hypothetical protein
MAQIQTAEPNRYDLSGEHIHITYSTTGVDGKPHFTYQDQQQTLNFSGGHIRTVQTAFS